ncbi:MAG: hypothetical protein ACXQS8_07220 [Candidatus Helarchaeales archaeon]
MMKRDTNSANCKIKLKNTLIPLHVLDGYFEIPYTEAETGMFYQKY